MSELESSVSKQYLNKTNVHKIKPPILGIDYGTKNIGLAITDYKGIVAQPLDTIVVKKGNFENFFSKLQQILERHKVETIVLGIPQSFKKEYLQNNERILQFKTSIEDITNTPVFLYDESYSTSTSYEILRSHGEVQKKSRKKIDRIAATYFLQELIDFKNKA
jgi:putative holliday junction resolvase